MSCKFFQTIFFFLLRNSSKLLLLLNDMKSFLLKQEITKIRTQTTKQKIDEYKFYELHSYY